MKKTTTKLPAKIVKYLEKAGVKHEILEHKTVYTAIDAANTLKKKMGEIAKSLLVKADKDYYLILLPANRNLNFLKIQKFISKLGGKEVKVVKIPGEKVVEQALKIKAGTLSAFGNLHKVPVLIDKELDKVNKAIFSSGSLNHSVEMLMNDFIKLEDGVLGSFGVKKNIKPQKKVAKKVIKKTKPTAKKKVTKKSKPVAKKKALAKKVVRKPVVKKKNKK